MKDEVQSALFSGKWLTHCAIVDPVKSRNYFQLSGDSNGDWMFVDYLICDIIDTYDIKNEDLWIQIRNAFSQ